MRINKNFIFYIFLISIVGFSSCNKEGNTNSNSTGIKGEGPIVTRILSVDNFSGVNIATSPNIIIKQGTQLEVKAIGQDNIIDLIDTDVENGVWKVKFTSAVSGNFDLSIEITTPSINSLEASSSGSIMINNFTNQTNNLFIETSSSGNITLNQFEGISSLEAITSSSGNIYANEDISTLQNLMVTLSSSGNYQGFTLSGDHSIVKSSSNGKVELKANNSLDVTISSSGNVYYKGAPTINKTITSSGILVDAN